MAKASTGTNGQSTSRPTLTPKQSTAPPVNPEEMPDAISQEIDAQSRRPWRRLAAKTAQAAAAVPDAALRNFGERHPDRLVQAGAIYGRLAGYSDKLQVEGSFDHELHHLSDAELYRRFYEASSTICRAKSVDGPSGEPSYPHHAAATVPVVERLTRGTPVAIHTIAPRSQGPSVGTSASPGDRGVTSRAKRGL